MKRVLLLAIVALVALPAWGQGDQNNFPGGGKGGCVATVATLSSVCGTTTGVLASVTDGTSNVDCTTGGSSHTATCQYTGSAWVAVANASNAIANLSGAAQALPLSGTAAGGVQPSSIYLDASQILGPGGATDPCSRALGAESTSVNGNYAVPDTMLGLSTGTPFPCPVNPFGDARNGKLELPSATMQLESAAVVQGISATNTGPTNIFGSGQTGTCGSGGACSTWLQKQTGMAHAQYGQINISSATPAVVAPGTSTVWSDPGSTVTPVFNTSWAGLNFCVISPATGVSTCQIIPHGGIVCTTAANTFPCSTTATITLGTLWTGGALTGVNYYISYTYDTAGLLPATVSISSTGLVTGTNTHFDSSWVGTTFTAALLGSGVRGALCAGPTVCTIASVSSATSMQLSANWSGAANTPLDYELGTVYGPIVGLAQSMAPVVQGSSFANATVDGFTPFGTDGATALSNCFEQERSYFNELKIVNSGAVALDIGCGGLFNTAQNSGPWENIEIGYPTAYGPNVVLNPVAATVSSVASTPVIYNQFYPGRSGLAIYTFSTVPTPAPARGQKIVCTGVANGTSHSTVFNGVWRVIDQITPQSVLVYLALPNLTNATSDSAGAGGSCLFYSSVVTLGNSPWYKSRGVRGITANPANFGYVANKPATYNGTPASNNLLSDFDIAGGAACNLQQAFAQGADVGYVIGEIGMVRGCNLFNIAGGLSTTVTYISNQFASAALSAGGFGGFTGSCIFGNWGNGSFGVGNSLLNIVDAFAGNSIPYGTSGNGNPDIPLYCLDTYGYPAIIVANTGVATPPTITNGNVFGKEGIQIYNNSTTPQFKAQGSNGQIFNNECLSSTASTGTPSPAACGGSSTGKVAIPASQTTYQVNTSAITASSLVFIDQITDNSGLPNSPTCGSTTVGLSPVLTLSRTAGTDFVLTISSVAQVTCFEYWIVN